MNEGPGGRESAVSQVPDDKLVVPGQRIGKWTLDMTINDLVSVTGPQNAGGIMASPIPVISANEYSVRVYGQSITDWTEDVWFHFWDKQSLYAGTFGESGQQVVFLAIYFDLEYRTAQGISWGMPRQSVEAVYGNPTATTERRMIYDEIGLAVRLRSDRSNDLLVFRPGTAKSIWKY